MSTMHAHKESSFFSDIRDSVSAANTLDTEQPVHPIFQKIGHDAQKTVGIANPLPIKKLNPGHPTATAVLALTTPTKIYVNEDLLGPLTFGMVNCTLHHEAIHAKYEDASKIQIATVGSGITGLVATYAGLRKFGIIKKRWIAVLGSWIIATNLGRKAVSQFIESRADCEGLRATKCVPCVQEMALYREISETTQEFNFMSLLDGGYISAQQTAQIAKELEGKVCNHHTIPENRAFSTQFINSRTLINTQLKTKKEAAAELREAEHATTKKEEYFLTRFQ